MANEVTVSGTLTHSDTGVSEIEMSTTSLSVNVTGNPRISGVQSVGFAAAEVLAIGEITSPGWAYIKNLDATNNVHVGTSAGLLTTNSTITIKPGEFALFRFTSNVTPYVIAAVAACLIEYLIVSD